MPTAQDYKDQKLELLVKKALNVRYTRYDFVPGQENNVLSSFFSEQLFSQPIPNTEISIADSSSWSQDTLLTSEMSSNGVSQDGTTNRFIDNDASYNKFKLNTINGIDYGYIKLYKNVVFTKIAHVGHWYYFK